MAFLGRVRPVSVFTAASVELLSGSIGVWVPLVEGEQLFVEEQLVVSIVVVVQLVVWGRFVVRGQLVVWLPVSLSPGVIVVRGQLVESEQLVTNCFSGVVGGSEPWFELCDASKAASRAERAGESRI